MAESGSNLVGTTIGDRYHLIRQLGDGGMGTVFKAADQVLRRFVAVKLLHGSAAASPAAVERFVREARSAAAIGHPNIIEVIDFGNDRGRPFLVMEYLKGQSLSQLIALEAPFRVARAAAIASHALAGLSAAHARGILHRDLKPANLMLVSRFGDRDFVKVCDFGFATLLAPKEQIHDGSALTPARTLVGTPAYAAPERLRGDDRPDARVDVYAIGVVLFEMLTGRRPFDAPTFSELAQKVRTEQPPLVSSLRPDVPRELDDVVARALAKERERRWPSAEMFAEALVPFGGRRVDDASDDPDPSDVFNMDLVRLRARATEHRHRITLTGPGTPATVPPPHARTDPGADPRGASGADLDIDIQIDESTPGIFGTTARGRVHPADPEARTTWVEPSQPAHAPSTYPPAAPIESSGREISGALVLTTLRFVQSRFGPRAMREVLASLRPSVATIFHQGVAEHDFVPLSAFEEFEQAVDTQLGQDDMQLFVHCGRAAGEALVTLFTQATTQPTCETVLVDLPRVAARGLHGVGLKSRTIGRGYGTIEVLDGPAHSLGTCVTLLGVVEQSFSCVDAKDLEVRCVSCRALGDDECLMHASWLAS